MRRPNVLPLVAVVLLLLLPNISGAKQIKVQRGDTVRSLAAQYLGNPDLWPAILSANSFESAAHVVPGATITIPVDEIKQADQAISKAEQAIRAATEEGARLLAAEEISQAISLRDAALEARKKAAWDDVAVNADASRKSALVASRLSRERVNVKSEAILEDKRGSVQSRPPEGLEWLGVEIRDPLHEREKVRTLSKSMAHILLSDQSRIRMRENSQAVIQKMEVNRLNKEQESKVSLVEGDLHVLLGGGSKSEFNLGLEGVDTEINSNDFWVNRTEEKTRFANFEGEIAIAARGEKTILGQNRGAVVDKGRVSKAIQLLERPTPVDPESSTVLHQPQVELNWQKVIGAKEYLVELSASSDFAVTLISERKIKEPYFKLPPLRDGVYFWRVAAIDTYGLLGKKCLPNWFEVDSAQYHPFLFVDLGKTTSYTNQPTLTFPGETEPEVPVTINTRKVAVAPDGTFVGSLTLEKGRNEITIRAARVDGEATVLTREVVYLPDEQVVLIPDKPFTFALADHHSAPDRTTWGGETVPGGWVTLQRGGNRLAATFADSAGRFSLLAPPGSDPDPLVAMVEAPTGQSRSLKLQAETILPPTLKLQPLPQQTSAKSVIVRGTVENTLRVTVAGADVPLQEGMFECPLALEEGENRPRIVAYGQDGATVIVEPRVIRDSTPPQVVDVALEPAISHGGETVQIRLVATDQTPLSRTIPIAITVGQDQLSGVLVATGERTYRGRIGVPPSSHGKVALGQATLIDRHGNEYAYSF